MGAPGLSAARAVTAKAGSERQRVRRLVSIGENGTPDGSLAVPAQLADERPVRMRTSILGWRRKPFLLLKTRCGMRRSLSGEGLLMHLALPHCGAPFPFGPGFAGSCGGC